MTIPFKTQLNAILTPTFGDEVYPIKHPEINGDADSVTNMFCIWTIAGGQSFNKLDGDSNMSRPRIQISIYSNDYTELDDAQKAVAAAMLAANQIAKDCVDTQTDSFNVAGALSNVSMTVPIEGQEVDTKRYYTHMTYYCWARS